MHVFPMPSIHKKRAAANAPAHLPNALDAHKEQQQMHLQVFQMPSMHKKSSNKCTCKPFICH
jgi:hypothetical protein